MARWVKHTCLLEKVDKTPMSAGCGMLVPGCTDEATMCVPVVPEDCQLWMTRFGRGREAYIVGQAVNTLGTRHDSKQLFREVAKPKHLLAILTQSILHLGGCQQPDTTNGWLGYVPSRMINVNKSFAPMTLAYRKRSLYVLRNVRVKMKESQMNSASQATA